MVAQKSKIRKNKRYAPRQKSRVKESKATAPRPKTKRPTGEREFHGLKTTAKQNLLVFGIISALSFLFYFNSIPLDYALDDSIVILQNEFTTRGVDGIMYKEQIREFNPETRKMEKADEWKGILSDDTFTGFFKMKKQLVEGGRYRPLSMITLAIEYEFLGFNPHVSHVINILFYALTGFLLFLFLAEALPDRSGQRWYLSVPFVASLLFVAHPVHTEVVTNIKGRDEIMALLFALGGALAAAKYIGSRRPVHLLVGFVLFFLGLMSKENTITFLAIIFLTGLYFYRTKLRYTFIALAPLFLAAVVFFSIRSSALDFHDLTPDEQRAGKKEDAGFLATLKRSVMGPDVEIPPELMNNPFLVVNNIDDAKPGTVSKASRNATISSVMGRYLLLMAYPHPLTFDYYPKHIPILDGFSDWRAWLPLLIYIFLIGFALWSMVKKLLVRLRVNLNISWLSRQKEREDIFGYSLWFYFATISVATNIFFIIGSFMNERFLFMPSVGFAILLAILLLELPKQFVKSEKGRLKATIIPTLLILGLYFAKTHDRNYDWKNDLTLFSTDVRTSEYGAKALTSAGGKIQERASQELTLKQFDVALHLVNAIDSIPPDVSADMKNMAKAHFEEKSKRYFEQSLTYLQRAIDVHPRYVDAFMLLGNTHFHYSQNFAKTMEIYKKILYINPHHNITIRNIDLIMKNDTSPDWKRQQFEELLRLNPNIYQFHYNLGYLYGGVKKDYEKSLQHMMKAYQLKPNDPKVIKDLGTAYAYKGDHRNAISYFLKAKEQMPRDISLLRNLATTYRNIGDVPNEVKAWHELTQVEPRQPANWLNLSYALLNNKQYKEAIQAATEALKLNANLYQGYLYIAMGLNNLGDYQQALANLQKAQKLQPKDPSIYDNYAVIYTNLGNATAANAARQRARQLRQR